MSEKKEDDKEGIWIPASKFKELFPDWEEMFDDVDLDKYKGNRKELVDWNEKELEKIK